MNKRIVFLDAGRVFVTFGERHEVLTRVAVIARAPHVPTYEDLIRCGILLEERGDPLEGPYDLIDSGQVSWRAIYEKFLSVTGLTAAQLPEFRFWATFCRHLEPISGVVAILEELHRAAVPLVVVSNGEFGSLHAADLVSFKYEVQWAGVVVSSLMGEKKPSAAIWDEAVRIGRERMPDLRPHEMVYVDDVARYCEAFTKYFPGACAINFDGTKQRARDLRRAFCEVGLPVGP